MFYLTLEVNDLTYVISTDSEENEACEDIERPQSVQDAIREQNGTTESCRKVPRAATSGYAVPRPQDVL